MAKSKQGVTAKDFADIWSGNISREAVRLGVSSLDSSKAWKKLGIQTIPGSTLSEAEITRFAKTYKIDSVKALQELIPYISMHDPNRRAGAPSMYSRGANGLTNALNAAGIKGDFRTFDQALNGLTKFSKQLVSEKATSADMFRVFSHAVYYQSTMQTYGGAFERMKSFQSRYGFQLNEKSSSDNLEFFKAAGISIDRVNKIVSGQTVPLHIKGEDQLTYKGGTKAFNITKDNIGKMTTNGLRSISYSADHLASVFLERNIRSKLGLKTPVIEGQKPFHELTTNQKIQFLDIVATRGELAQKVDPSTDFLDQRYVLVDQRVALVASVIKERVEACIEGLMKDGQLDTSNLSEPIQKHLENSAVFPDQESKAGYLRELLMSRCSDAAIQGALASNDKAEINAKLAEVTSTSENEVISVPAYSQDGAAAGMVETTIFKPEVSQYALQWEGHTLFYDGNVEINGKMDVKTFNQIKDELQSTYGKQIDGLDLSRATPESFVLCDPLSTGFAVGAIRENYKKAEAFEDKLNAVEVAEEEKNNNLEQGAADDYKLYRGLPLYKQYLHEALQRIKDSGLKFIFTKEERAMLGEQTRDQNTQDPPTQGGPNTKDPNAVPPVPGVKEYRAELKGRVEAASKDDPNASKYAKLKNDLQEEFGIDARFIGTNVMLGLLSEINSWKGVPVKDCIAKFKGEFEKACENLGKTDLRAKSEYLSSFAAEKYSGIHGNEAAVATVARCESFAKDYAGAYLQEEVDEEIANLGEEYSNAGQERQQEINADLKNGAELALIREGLKFAVSEGLAPFMDNQDKSASEIQEVELPKIIPAQPAAAVVAEVAPEQ